MLFDEWPIWPRSYFHADAWLRVAYNAALKSANQPRRAKTLRGYLKSVQRALDRIDFDHPLTQWALWIGGVFIPISILVAVFV